MSSDESWRCEVALLLLLLVPCFAFFKVFDWSFLQCAGFPVLFFILLGVFGRGFVIHAFLVVLTTQLISLAVAL